jgi:hypothetical protein
MYTPNLLRSSLGALAVAVSLGLAAGCTGPGFGGTSDPSGNLIMDFSGFNQYSGKTLYMKVTDLDAATVAEGPTVIEPVVIGSGAFSVTAFNAFHTNHRHNIDIWVDVDGNGLLDHSPNGFPVGVDASWRIERVAMPGNTRMSFTPTTAWTDITPF